MLTINIKPEQLFICSRHLKTLGEMDQFYDVADFYEAPVKHLDVQQYALSQSADQFVH